MRQKLAGVVELTPEQLGTLEAHYRLLLRWNRILNLTSIETAEATVERHYCESVFLAVHLPAGALCIADIGAGAGFPGFPLAVVRSDCRVTLIESHRRKAAFLRESSRELHNIRVLAKRAEDVGEQFDRAVSRAVSYRGLAPILKKLAGAADLLTGREVPPEKLGFTWSDPIRLPWGNNRFLRSGVSRGNTGGNRCFT